MLAPTPYSKYSLAVAEFLQLGGVQVCLMVVPSTYDLKRISTTWRREGVGLLYKIWTKILLSRRHTGETPLGQLMKSEGISLRPLPQYCAQHGIQYRSVKDINGRDAVAAVRDHEVDLLVFTGGGLIRRGLLVSPRVGVLNCHWGLLPEYRGMDTTLWAEWERQPTGISLHLMDPGVDTGPVISTHAVARAPDESFESFYGRMEVISLERIVATVASICGGNLELSPQDPAQGKQYYIMHNRLREILVDRLENVRES